MYEFQDLTPISGRFRTNFKILGISGQRPGLHLIVIVLKINSISSMNIGTLQID